VDIVPGPFWGDSGGKGQAMRKRTGLIACLFVLLLLLALIPSPGGSQNQPPGAMQNKSSVVYVCACLKTRSCECMTESKTEGPCACGTHGGPPLKAVPSDSAWARENRSELAK
jgi:hypothetical protein